jgi:hypothetical protein
MSAATQQTKGRHIPEDDTLHNHRCENLKSYINPGCFVTLNKMLILQILCRVQFLRKSNAIQDI